MTGPIGLYVVSVGYFAAGVSGAVAGWLAMSTPALAILLLLRFIGRRAESPRVKRLMESVVVASAGLLLSAVRNICRAALGLGKALQVRPQFIPHAAKPAKQLFLRALDRGRIIEAVMQPRDFADKHRTTLLRVVADRQDVIEILSRELIHRLRAVRRNVDTDFLHDRYRLGANAAWFRTRAVHRESVSRIMPQQAFGHL